MALSCQSWTIKSWCVYAWGAGGLMASQKRWRDRHIGRGGGGHSSEIGVINFPNEIYSSCHDLIGRRQIIKTFTPGLWWQHRAPNSIPPCSCTPVRRLAETSSCHPLWPIRTPHAWTDRSSARSSTCLPRGCEDTRLGWGVRKLDKTHVGHLQLRFDLDPSSFSMLQRAFLQPSTPAPSCTPRFVPTSAKRKPGYSWTPCLQ